MKPALGDFDFAQLPAAGRGASRLLDATRGTPVGRVFRELPDLLRAGDLLVVNDTGR